MNLKVELHGFTVWTRSFPGWLWNASDIWYYIRFGTTSMLKSLSPQTLIVRTWYFSSSWKTRKQKKVNGVLTQISTNNNNQCLKRGCHMPVSYTHLDVYKRQRLMIVLIIPLFVLSVFLRFSMCSILHFSCPDRKFTVTDIHFFIQSLLP